MRLKRRPARHRNMVTQQRDHATRRDTPNTYGDNGQTVYFLPIAIRFVTPSLVALRT
jgi:hypothetical protein